MLIFPSQKTESQNTRPLLLCAMLIIDLVSGRTLEMSSFKQAMRHTLTIYSSTNEQLYQVYLWYLLLSYYEIID